MANLGGEYNAENGQTMEDRDALPAGEYIAKLVKSERQEAKTGNGNAYINCEFEIHEGQYEGRRFWTMLTLWNGNAQAVQIAERELNSIMYACGHLRVSDTDELHGIPMRVTLTVKEDPQYGKQNRVQSYKSLNAAPSGHDANGQRPPQAASRKAPWSPNAA